MGRELRFRVTWPQQIEADLTKTAMVRPHGVFRSENMQARLVMMIHESIWVEAPVQDEPEMKRLIRDVMITIGDLDVPLEVDFERPVGAESKE